MGPKIPYIKTFEDNYSNLSVLGEISVFNIFLSS